MTPTERAAFEAAIAALEHLKAFLKGLDEEYKERSEISDVDEIFRDNIWFIGNTLTSLRAIAPAPADDKLPCDVAVAPATIFRAGVDTRLLLDAIEMRRKHSNDYPITDSIVAHLRPAPADQSDAGRDGELVNAIELLRGMTAGIAERIAINTVLRALATADRDAIREALKEAWRCLMDTRANQPHDTEATLRLITAALALIGEGQMIPIPPRSSPNSRAAAGIGMLIGAGLSIVLLLVVAILRLL